MDIHIFALVFTLGLVLLILGLIKQQFVVLLFSGIIIFFCGIWLLNGLGHAGEYNTYSEANQSIIEVGGKNTTVTVTTSTTIIPEGTETLHKNTFTTTAGFIMSLTGAMLILISAIGVLKREPESFDDEKENDEE